MSIALAAPVHSLRNRDQITAVVASGGMAVAAGAHVAAFVAHRGEGPAVATFFVAVAVLQVVAAMTILRGPRLASRVAIVAGSLGLVLLWALSRTAGVPFGSHGGASEPIGVVDATAAAAQITVVATMLISATIGVGARRIRARVGVVALSLAIAVGGAALTPAASHADQHAPSPRTAGSVPAGEADPFHPNTGEHHGITPSSISAGPAAPASEHDGSAHDGADDELEAHEHP